MDDSTLDIDKKERQIAQLAGPQTYKYILEECYPALRHSDYTVNYTVRGFNLEETKEIIKTRPQLLSLQEIYRIAKSCQPGSEEFNRSFQVAATMFPDDPYCQSECRSHGNTERRRPDNSEEASCQS